MKRKILIVVLLLNILLVSILFLTTTTLTTIFITASVDIVIAICLGGLYFANKLAKKTNWYKNQLAQKLRVPDNVWYRENDIRNYDIAAIGSSAGKYAFDFTNTNILGWNWCEAPQNMQYGYKILQNYHSILKKDAYVIITLLPFSGLNVKYRDSAYDKYYLTLAPVLIDNYNPKKAGLKNPIRYNPKESIKRIIKDVKPLSERYSESAVLSDSDRELDAMKWVNGWQKQFGIKSFDDELSAKNLKGKEFRVKLLSDIIEFCLEREYNPVIVIPPVTHELSSKFSDTFMENYIYSFIRSANKENAKVLDYFRDEKLAKPELYYNSFFLNKKGRTVFTEKVLQELKLL